MKITPFLMTLGVLTSTMIASAQAATVVVIQGDQSAFGRRVFSGFSSLANERISAFQYEEKNEAALINKMKKLAPNLLFTLGEVPLPKLVALLPSTPFVVSNYHAEAVARKANVVVMESALPVGSGLKMATELLPNIKTVGIVYNPKLSGDTFQKLVTFTGNLKLKLASLKVDTPQDVKAFISAFSGKVDLLYWIRDSTTADEASLKEIYGFAEQNNVPVVSTDPGHMERGATLSVALDPFRIGESAWKTAEVIIKEGKIPQMPVQIKASQLVGWLSLDKVKRFGVTAETLSNYLQSTVKEGYGLRIVP